MQRKPRSADETPKEGGTQLASHDPFREMAEIDNPHGTAAGLDRSRAREGGVFTPGPRGGEAQAGEQDVGTTRLDETHSRTPGGRLLAAN